MNTQVRDTPADFGQRLLAARKSAKMTRAELSEQSGVHVKVIERAETLNIEPKASKLRLICAALGVTIEDVLGDDGEQSSPAISRTPTRIPRAVPAGGSDDDADDDSGKNKGDPVGDLLADLDSLREAHFANAAWGARAKIKDLRAQLECLESDALLGIARERGIDPVGLPSAGEMQKTLEDDEAAAETMRGKVEDRIIDAVILGADLQALSIDALKNLASDVSRQTKIDEPFFGWDDDPQPIIDTILEPLKQLTLAGRGWDLSDEHRYPRAS